MHEARTGWVVAVGGEISQPGVDEAVRIASFAALQAVIRAVMLEVGPHGIDVSSITPGCTAGEPDVGAGRRLTRPAQAADLDAVAAAVAAACNSLSHLSAAKPRAMTGARPS